MSASKNTGEKDDFEYLDLEKIKVQKTLSNEVCLKIEHDVLNGFKTHVKIQGFARKSYSLKYGVPSWNGLNFILIELYKQNDRAGPVVRSIHDSSMSSSVKVSKLFLPVKEVLLVYESMMYLKGEFMKIFDGLSKEEQGNKIIRTEIQLANDKEKYMHLEGNSYGSASFKYYLDLSDVKQGLKNTATFSTFVGTYLLSVKEKIIEFDKNCHNNTETYV